MRGGEIHDGIAQPIERGPILDGPHDMTVAQEGAVDGVLLLGEEAASVLDHRRLSRKTC